MKFRGILLISLLIFLSSWSLALYYGDEFYHPVLTTHLSGYYEINYNQSYFNESNVYKPKDSLHFLYHMTNDLVFTLRNQYLTNKLTFGVMYKMLYDIDVGEIGLGVRNIGTSFGDSNSPYPREYIVYAFPYKFLFDFTVNAGVQHMRNNGNDFYQIFGGLETRIMDLMDISIFHDYNYLGLALWYPLADNINLFVAGYGLMQNAKPADYKVFEIGIQIFNFSKTERGNQEGLYSYNQFTIQALHKLKKQEETIKLMQAKSKAMEYTMSEGFQTKLINELIAQKVVERELRDSETMLLKATMKHIQKGLEYFYLNDMESAFQEYNIANSLIPNMSLIHERLGSIYYRLGHWEMAKQEWLLTLSLNPKNDNARKQLKILETEHPELFTGLEIGPVETEEPSAPEEVTVSENIGDTPVEEVQP